MNERGLKMNDIRAVLQLDEWLTRGQLADLLGVYYGTITANIKAVISSGAVKPSFEGTLVQVGKTVFRSVMIWRWLSHWHSDSTLQPPSG